MRPCPALWLLLAGAAHTVSTAPFRGRGADLGTGGMGGAGDPRSSPQNKNVCARRRQLSAEPLPRPHPFLRTPALRPKAPGRRFGRRPRGAIGCRALGFHYFMEISQPPYEVDISASLYRQGNGDLGRPKILPQVQTNGTHIRLPEALTFSHTQAAGGKTSESSERQLPGLRRTAL